MNGYLLFSLFLLGTNPNATIDSKVDSVIVYPDRAMIFRKARTNLTASQTLTFKDLPGMLDDNSVRIKAERLRIGEVQIRRGYLEEPTPKVKELEKKIKDLENEIRELNNEKEVLKAKESFLNSIKLSSPEIISKELFTGKVSPDAWTQALKFLSREFTETKERQTEIDDEIKELNKRLDALKRELADKKAKFENRKEISCEVSVAEPGNYEILLSYLIPQAVFWAPYYELRARPEQGKVGISYYAKLSQRTGEDWSSVSVILSTGKPALAGVAPEPYPWYLTLEEPRPLFPAARGFEKAEFEAMRMPLETAETEPQVQRIETGISLQYVIPGKITLASGEPEKKLGLYSASLPAEFEYYTLPRAQPIAYLKGKIENTTDYIFLDGRANTYVADEFTGETRIPSISPAESSEISFGVDERVKVEHQLVKTFTSKGGLFNKREKREFLYKTTVENFHPKEIKITLIEQVPVSQQQEIVVRVTKLEPKPKEQDPNKGTFTYETVLTPKKRFEVNFGFSVEYPQGKRIIGLF